MQLVWCRISWKVPGGKTDHSGLGTPATTAVFSPGSFPSCLHTQYGVLIPSTYQCPTLPCLQVYLWDTAIKSLWHQSWFPYFFWRTFGVKRTVQFDASVRRNAERCYSAAILLPFFHLFCICSACIALSYSLGKSFLNSMIYSWLDVRPLDLISDFVTYSTWFYFLGDWKCCVE
jgi:hypothetical protein